MFFLLAICMSFFLASRCVAEDLSNFAKKQMGKAKYGDVEAQFNLALCYQSGIGVQQNQLEAIKWYGKAVEQGYANAQHNLGVYYNTGQAVPQDYSEAARWYTNVGFPSGPRLTFIGLREK